MILPSSPRAACPKCGHQRPATALSCARCGLVFAKWTPDKAAARASLDERGEALWAAVLADWQSTEKHDAFAKHCSVTETLAAAGRCYRERLDASPKDPLGTRMQARIVTIATVQLPVHGTALPQPVTRSTWFWVVMVLVGVGGLLGGLVFGH